MGPASDGIPHQKSSLRLLLVASTTGYQTQMFADAAAGLGMQLMLATDRCHVLEDPWGDRALAVRFDDPEGAASILANLSRVDGIVALGDRPAYVAAVIAERLGMRYSPAGAVGACRDKFAARQRLEAAGLLVPKFFRVPLSEDPAGASKRAKYPCVLKPLGLSGSRGVIRANTPAQFVDSFHRIARMLDKQDEYLQVERFIPGPEFALEGILTGGCLRMLALFDKPDPLDGPFFEETIYVTPSRYPANVQEAIGRIAGKAVKALGLTEGPVHAEMRHNAKGVWMLEVAARPIGGLCARVLPGLPELILRHAAGEDISAVELPRTPAGVMMIPIPREGIYQGVSGTAQALSVPGIEDLVITAKQGQRLVPLPEGSSYLGFLFARAKTALLVEQSLRQAHAVLRFETTAALPVF